MLTLKDLDFDNIATSELSEGLEEIKKTRKTLGQFTVRDTMEAIYGTEYTIAVLGEDGGNDVLMEDMTPVGDLRELAGLPRGDVGGNRLPANGLSGNTEAMDALVDQEKMTEKAALDSIREFYAEDSKLYRNQGIDTADTPLIEDRDEIIKLLESNGVIIDKD